MNYSKYFLSKEKSKDLSFLQVNYTKGNIY
jgi:hypothetical protein